MKYLNLIFSKSRVGSYADDHINHYDSTTLYRVNKLKLDELNTDNYKILRYKLRDNETVSKWVNHFLETEQTLQGQLGEKEWAYNFYTVPTWETVNQGRAKLNTIIDTINQRNWFTIPESLKLDVDNDTVIEHEKLNELHFIFEHKIYETVGHEDRDELFELLEGINNLVHLCEKFIPGKTTSTEYHSYRLLDEVVHKTLPMEDSDYNNMDVDIFGTVTLDFGTVGKDLGACFYTEDLELVRRKEIKQQEYIKANISFDWSNYEHNKENEYTRYYKWCEDNNVEEYGYDFRQPKYNLGRVVLGDLENKTEYNAETVQQILVEYPYFGDIVLSDN